MLHSSHAHFLRSLLFLLIVGGLAGGVVAEDAESKKASGKPAAASGSRVRFNRDIRPILADKCFVCHGPDENERQADLRLDVREDATADRDGTPAVAPGNASKSELIRRIAAADEDERMPPGDSGRSLSNSERATLRRWIEEGAEYEDHWSYTRPARVKPPSIGTSKVTPIDAFVIDRLKRAGWRLSPEADRRTLIRRITFDLTGLPPTAERVEAFANSKSKRAYEELVDELLASEHYGERLAELWLDAVRYADTNGIHGDNHREHWLYRDYVIRSFNANKPFDVFTREQLAGDLGDNPTREQRIGSGYNRLNMTTREGGAQAKEYRAKYAADRVRNAATVWLGSTMGCAECHDHKFDPFSQRDFYSFAAFFADVDEIAVGAQRPERIPTPEQLKKLAELDAAIPPLTEKLNTATPVLAKAQEAWEAELRTNRTEWTLVEPLAFESKGGAKLEPQKDHSVLVTGAKPDRDVYTVSFQAEEAFTALRLEAIPDPSAPAKGPGRAGNGNFVVTEVEVHVNDKRVELAVASSEHSQQGWPAKAAADGNNDTGWAVLPRVGKLNSLVLEAKADSPAGEVRVVIHQNHGRGTHTLARFRLATTNRPRPVVASAHGLPAGIEAILALVAKDRTQKQQNQIAAHYRSVAPALQGVRDQLKKLNQQRKSIADSAPLLLVTKSIKPRVMRVLPRGNWLDDSGPVVSPDTPSFLPRLPNSDEANSDKPNSGKSASRAELAEWIVAKENPLTARVFVNRLWGLAFGEGIVRSMGDFGAQGEWPTHPALLDNLAVDFQESNWDVKAIVKQIVMSQAYRQSSEASAEMVEKDPYNRLLARQNRYRLPAEMIRDNALSVSGLIVHRVGGPSVKPYQPFGYWSHLNFPKRIYKPDEGSDQYRRGLYTYWCRTFLHPSMVAFDAPSREECTVHRARSNTPLAALVLLNDPTYVEAARAMAERVLTSPAENDGERLNFLYQQALNREPKPAEAKIIMALFARHLSDYQADQEQAEGIQKNGFRKKAEPLDAAQMAAWTSVCRVVFNLHEFVYRN